MGHSNKDSFSQKSSHSSRENVDPFVGGNEGNATIEQKRPESVINRGSADNESNAGCDMSEHKPPDLILKLEKTSKNLKSPFTDHRGSTALRGQNQDESFVHQPGDELASPTESSNSFTGQPFFLKKIQKMADSKAEKSNRVGHFGVIEKIEENAKDEKVLLDNKSVKKTLDYPKQMIPDS